MEKIPMHTKRLCLALAVLFMVPVFATAQLRFTQPTVNLGELRGGPIYEHRFDFVNDSPQSIEIIDFRLGCGCLQPVLDKRVYQPGEKGTLLMNIRTLGQPNGARTWQAHVQYRSGDKRSKVSLTLGANIRNEVTVEPSIVAMTVETTLKQELTFTDHRPLPTKIAKVLASSPAISVTTEALANGVTKVTLEVSRSALTAARQEETLNIYTDDANYRHLQVPITLIKAPRADVTATPDRIELTSGSQLVRLRAPSDKAVRIEKATSDHPALKCTWASGPGDDATLKITVDAGHLGAANAVVRVTLAEPAGQTIAIPVVLRKE
jgi:Protein of unknown function (DUF1573)